MRILIILMLFVGAIRHSYQHIQKPWSSEEKCEVKKEEDVYFDEEEFLNEPMNGQD